MKIEMMVSADHHKFPRLGSWKVNFPTSEAPGLEPAHVHVTNKQLPGIRGKIWIGINDSYPIGNKNRYILKADDNTLPVNASTKKDIFDTILEMFAENWNGITNLFEYNWRGGWYNNI